MSVLIQSNKKTEELIQQYFSFINYATNKLTTYINCFYLIKYLEIKQYKIKQYTVAKAGLIAATENLEKMVYFKKSQEKSQKIERMIEKFSEKSEIN